MSDQIIRTRITAKENTECIPFTYKSILYFTCLEILIFTKIWGIMAMRGAPQTYEFAPKKRQTNKTNLETTTIGMSLVKI